MDLITYDAMTENQGEVLQYAYALYNPRYPYEMHLAVANVSDPSKVSLSLDTVYYVREGELDNLVAYPFKVETNYHGDMYTGTTAVDISITHVVTMMNASRLLFYDAEDICLVTYDETYTTRSNQYTLDNTYSISSEMNSFHKIYDYGAHYNESAPEKKEPMNVFAVSAKYYSFGRKSRVSVFMNYFVTRVSSTNYDEGAAMGAHLFEKNLTLRGMFVDDIDQDGHMDVLIGTQGNNTFFDCDDECDLTGGLYALYGTANASKVDTVEVRGRKDGVVSVDGSYGYNFVWDVQGADVDGDGDVDLVVALKPNSTTVEIHLYLCDGPRSYTDTMVLYSGNAQKDEVQPMMVRVVDINGDGFLDVTFVSTTAVLSEREEHDRLVELSYEVSPPIKFVSVSNPETQPALITVLCVACLQGPSSVSVITQLKEHEHNARFEDALLIHETQNTIFKVDVYPPKHNRTGGTDRAELSLSEKTVGNKSVAECLRFSFL
ncbi:hypothetical protein CYMTET_41242 [Cymbomonas tetramitiformis]|uniref:FG-GAP repeat protein n=1 Tax=Cymbomonas tetramitiformis TaxID=36881 RepID=A0AAE0C8K7_9CHLO|nr:hypothetical protein CYMTET_41242 [Cymbomonas tetramitiformis]|eukprot:gene894-1397_t